MGVICLLGRHGSGKSTLGRAMAEQGYVHISMGLLRRLAASNQFPRDIPVALMLAMRRIKAGHPLPADVVNKLIKHIATLPFCVLDGFPVTLEQVSLLPHDTVFGVVWTPAGPRAERLAERSANTLRQWTPGLHSDRDIALAGLIAHIRNSHRVIFVNNRDSGQAALATTARALIARLQR